jgi:chromosome segregation ATPase
MRQDLQDLRDQLTQSQGECELQRKQLEAQKSEMTGKLVEQQQLVAKLKEATSSKAKETEDKLSLSRQQLQDLQGQLTQSQSQGEAQRKQLEEQRQLVAKLTEQRDSVSRNAQVNKDELLRSNRDLVSTRQQLQDLQGQLTQSQHESEVQRKQHEAQKSELSGKLKEQRQLVAELTEQRDSVSRNAKANKDELLLSNRDLVSMRQDLQDLRGQLMQSQREGEGQRKQHEAQQSEMSGKLEEQRLLIAQLTEGRSSTSKKVMEREDELLRSNRDLVSTRQQLQDLQGQLTQSRHEGEVQRKQHEAQKSELSGKLKEQRQLVAELTEQRDSVSRNAKANKDKLLLSNQDLVSMRQDLQDLRGQLMQSQREGEGQRKQHEAQQSEMSRKLEEQRLLIAQLTEGRSSTSKKVIEREDELLRSNRDLVSTRQQLQDLQGQLTQSQHEGEVQRKQHEAQKSELSGKLKEQRQLVAELTEQRDSVSRNAKTNKDELSLSNQDLVSTRQDLQDLRGQLMQSQREGEGQRKQHEAQQSEMSGKLEEQRLLIAQLTEGRSSMSKKVIEREDELLRSNQDLVSTRQQLQDLRDQLMQSQRERETQRKQHESQKGEMTGMLEAQREAQGEAVAQLTKERDFESKKMKEREAELSRFRQDLDSTRQQLQMLRDQVELQRKQDQDHKSDMTGLVEEQRGLIAQLMEKRDSTSKKAKEMQDELSRSNRELERQLQMLWNRLLESRGQWEAQRKQNDQQRLQSEDKATLAKLHELQTEHAQVLALLKIRTDELSGTYSFLDKADLLPVADVTAMVAALNSEILNTAASIADSLQFRKVKAAAGNEQKIAYERVRSQLGPKVAFLLTSVSHAEDAMLLQFALQCRLVWDCKTIIESWGFGKLQDHLVEIYEGVQKTGKLHNV